MNEYLEIFLSSFSKELESKVKRLDDIIGRDHWLSVGIYKESLLKGFLREILPKKFEVSTGFIISADKSGELLKSAQMDIIIWNSNDYSPFFKDGDFVLIPPEACRAVIEVKSSLRLEDTKKSIENFDHFTKFYYTLNSRTYSIKKYIFSFNLDEKAEFPDSILSKLADTYNRSKLIPIEKRQDFIYEKKTDDTFSIDGIFLLGHGLVKKELQIFPDGKYHIIFRSYSNAIQNNDLIYAALEDELQKSLNAPTFLEKIQNESKHPGMSALRGIIGKIPITRGQSKVIIPPISKKDLDPRWKENEFIPKSFKENKKK